MKHYIHYYSLLRYSVLSKKGLLFTAVFFIAHLVLYESLFSQEMTVSITPMFMFFFAIFIMHLYRYQSFNDVSNIQFQFPMDYKQRTRFELLTVFVITFLAMLFITLLFGSIILIISALAGVSNSGGTIEDDNYLVLLYAVAHHLIILAAMFPMAYVKSAIKRYLFSALFLLGLYAFNVLVLSLSTQAMNNTQHFSVSFRGKITEVLDQVPFVTPFVISYFTVSVAMVYVSYRVALKLNCY